MFCMIELVRKGGWYIQPFTDEKTKEIWITGNIESEIVLPEYSHEGNTILVMLGHFCIS